MKIYSLFLAMLTFFIVTGSLRADFTVINKSQHTIKVKRGTDREEDLKKGTSQIFSSAKTSDEVQIRGPLQLKVKARVIKGQKVTVIRRGLKWEIKIGR